MSTIWKIGLGLAALAGVVWGSCNQSGSEVASGTDPPACGAPSGSADPISTSALAMLMEGKQTFRYATFGDETFWGDALKLHQAIEGGWFGGVGPGVSPKEALAVGLKVDMDAVPPEMAARLKSGALNLDDPANTLALIKANAVLGVTGFFKADSSLSSVGIQCALCHSTVDDALGAGIGHRLDGWANRDLNVGAIINLAPDVSVIVNLLKKGNPAIDETAVRSVLAGWGPGKFDAELLLDGVAAKPGGAVGSSATLIPAAFGLAGVNLHTYTGWGSVTYWNAFVANLEMHGQGTFYDPRLNNSTKFPVATAAGLDNVRGPADQITGKLAALHFYQLAIQAPVPPMGSYDHGQAASGQALFNGKAKCATCHVPPLFTEPGWNMHKASEIGIDDFQAKRSPDIRYRTTPLKGLWSHQKGGFYHDGRFPGLSDVIDHYNSFLSLGLTASEKAALIEYLKSI